MSKNNGTTRQSVPAPILDRVAPPDADLIADTDPLADISDPRARLAARAAANGSGKKIKVSRKDRDGAKIGATIPWTADVSAVGVARAASQGTTITDSVTIPGVKEAGKRPTTFTGSHALYALADFGAL